MPDVATLFHLPFVHAGEGDAAGSKAQSRGDNTCVRPKRRAVADADSLILAPAPRAPSCRRGAPLGCCCSAKLGNSAELYRKMATPCGIAELPDDRAARSSEEINVAPEGASELDQSWDSWLQSVDSTALNNALTDMSWLPTAPQNIAGSVTVGGGEFDPERLCWGTLLTGRQCTPGWKSGTGHFKNHFCPSCKSIGVFVDPSLAKVLPADEVSSFANPSSHGIWGTIIAEGTRVQYRVVNQTAKCHGPYILLLRDEASARALGHLKAIPTSYLQNGLFPLELTKGTLVPTLAPRNELVPRLPKASKRSRSDDDGSSEPSSEPEPLASKSASRASSTTGLASSGSDVASTAAPTLSLEQASPRDLTACGLAAAAAAAVESYSVRVPTTTIGAAVADGHQSDLLLVLASEQAQLATSISRFFDMSAAAQDLEDSPLGVYRAALRRLVAPLLEASEALARVKAADSMTSAPTVPIPAIKQPPTQVQLPSRGDGGLLSTSGCSLPSIPPSAPYSRLISRQPSVAVSANVSRQSSIGTAINRRSYDDDATIVETFARVSPPPVAAALCVLAMLALVAAIAFGAAPWQAGEGRHCKTRLWGAWLTATLFSTFLVAALQLACGMRPPTMRDLSVWWRGGGRITPEDDIDPNDLEAAREECQRLKPYDDSVACSVAGSVPTSTDSLPVVPTSTDSLPALPTPPRLLHPSPAARSSAYLLPSVFKAPERRGVLASPMASTDSLPSVQQQQQRNGVFASPIASTDSLPSVVSHFRRLDPRSPLASTDVLPRR